MPGGGPLNSQLITITMTPERRSLFIQFTLLFLLTSAVLLMALFFTRDTDDGPAGGGQEQQLYASFRNFDHLKPDLIRLVNSVNSQASLMVTQNGRNTSALFLAQGYIDKFERFQNTVNDTFAIKVTDMLRQYLTTTNQLKTLQDDKKRLDDLYDACQKNREIDAINSRGQGANH